MIPYGKHAVDSADVAAVVDVLENRFLTQGDTVPLFEKALCDYTGCQHAVAVNSATSGLHIACLALDVSSDDIVWTVPNSFVASANCARYCGASISFIDIDPITRNISIERLEQKLKSAVKTNKTPKALIVVHFSGLSCDMKQISELIKPYNIKLIEDAAHALGGTYLGQKVGSCAYSDMVVLSFHPVKSITSAEGGAVLTNDSELHRRLSLFSKHGVTKDPAAMSNVEGDWYYQQVELGYNYRLSDLHAALGFSQLKKLDAFVEHRVKLAEVYHDELAALPLALPTSISYSSSAWHLYMVEVQNHDRKVVFDALRERRIGVNVHYIPIHLQPYYRDLGFNIGDYPNAEAFYKNAITLPLFPTMTADEQRYVIDALYEVLN
ncbi:UDP-4-amino-4,6-dideoxy-N-acetyl-beta-L-altrosamine transaminase [Alteromonadaceae bacterium M269]|nr:UDP-4-amino-4,6-dideoxy-N-acetyl-beta-L-altrosamine transaminase [Alteromonadaceae bacterium M269]